MALVSGPESSLESRLSNSGFGSGSTSGLDFGFCGSNRAFVVFLDSMVHV